MQTFKRIIFVCLLLAFAFCSYGSCSNFSHENTSDLNEGKWEYQYHQKKRMRWKQRQKEKKQEKRESILKLQEERKSNQEKRRKTQSRNKKRSAVASEQSAALTTRDDDFSTASNSPPIVPPLDLTIITAPRDFDFNESNNGKESHSGVHASRKKKKEKKHITFDNPSEELSPLEGRILEILKHNASKKNNYEDMCTLILRPWCNHQDKKAFLLNLWNDYLAHVTYETDNILQSFAQFLLCRRYGDKKTHLPAIRQNLRHVLSNSSTHDSRDCIRYHMSIDAIDVYLFSQKKEFLNVAHVHNARKFLKEMGEKYPIAAHYYVMFSLNKKLIPLWEKDRYDPYDQAALFNCYQRLLNLGFPETYMRSLNLHELSLTERQNQRLLTLFKEKQVMTHQEREKAYRRYIKNQK